LSPWSMICLDLGDGTDQPARVYEHVRHRDARRGHR
jgi:hypothetical protein